WRRCSVFTRRAAPTAPLMPASSGASSASSPRQASSSASSASPGGSPPAPRIVSATLISPRDCRSFSGAAFRTTSFVTGRFADDSFLNERLAAHYGIRDVYGSHFRKVTFTGGTRGGLLGQSSILTVTSYPNRTSVTMRGRWLLANILGAPPPPPPPDIPALKEAGADGQPRSLRDRMEMHRRNPACASCHQRMDPLGFALENFDALG